MNVLNCFQVYVTGADGEQMVLSGPEAAALLAQAGISLGEQEQVSKLRVVNIPFQIEVALKALQFVRL